MVVENPVMAIEMVGIEASGRGKTNRGDGSIDT